VGGPLNEVWLLSSSRITSSPLPPSPPPLGSNVPHQSPPPPQDPPPPPLWLRWPIRVCGVYVCGVNRCLCVWVCVYTVCHIRTFHSSVTNYAPFIHTSRTVATSSWLPRFLGLFCKRSGPHLHTRTSLLHMWGGGGGCRAQEIKNWVFQRWTWHQQGLVLRLHKVLVQVYIYIYIYTFVYIYIYVCICVHICIYVYICVCIYIQLDRHRYRHRYSDANIGKWYLYMFITCVWRSCSGYTRCGCRCVCVCVCVPVFPNDLDLF